MKVNKSDGRPADTQSAARAEGADGAGEARIGVRSFFRCGRFWLNAVPIFLFMAVLGVLLTLRFGNPQWNKYIYLFQAFVSPAKQIPVDEGYKKREGLIFPPKDFDGIWRTWYINGRLRTETSFIDGKVHGRCRAWYDNGQLSSDSYCIEERDPYGCNNLTAYGIAREWHKNGRLIACGDYKDGHMWNGSFLFGDGYTKGTLLIAFYKDGVQLSVKEFTEAELFQYLDSKENEALNIPSR